MYVTSPPIYAMHLMYDKTIFITLFFIHMCNFKSSDTTYLITVNYFIMLGDSSASLSLNHAFVLYTSTQFNYCQKEAIFLNIYLPVSLPESGVFG